MVMVGLVTLVINLVDSVTSTSFLVSFFDMYSLSAPILSVSSGTLPGQSSTTIGLSAASVGQVTDRQRTSDTVEAIRFMVKSLQELRMTCVMKADDDRYFPMTVSLARSLRSSCRGLSMGSL